MKKLFFGALIVLQLLCGCSNKTSNIDYTNIPINYDYTNISINYGSFHIGDIVYSLTPSGLIRYHAN